MSAEVSPAIPNADVRTLPRGSTADRRQLGLLALGALIVLHIILVALALRPNQVVPSASLPPLSPGATATETASASQAASNDPVLTAPPVPANTLLVPEDGSLLLSEPSACSGPDSQAPLAEGWRRPAESLSWEMWNPPGEVVTRLGITGGRTVFTVASAPDCGVQQFFPASGPNLEWGSGQPATGVYYLVQRADGTQAIGTATGEVPSPCDASTIALAATDSTAALLCGDGAVKVTADGGASWNTEGAVAEGRALTFGGSGLMYALTSDSGCNGLAVASSNDNGKTWIVAGCAEGASSYGAVALAATGNRVTVVDTDRSTYRSTDGGRTFKGGV